MSDQTYDVVGIGNAIVDVICHVDDGFVDEHTLQKGAMTLIDEDRAHQLYAAMPPGIEASGGSAANTIAGIGSFGGKVAYIGKVRDDQLGEVFRHDIRAIGVDYDVPLGAEGPATARCLIVVTPDAERTMNTFLGISNLLEPSDVDESVVSRAKIVYCEGYLWDVESAKEAMLKGMRTAKAAGGRTSLTLSDTFCVDRHRTEFHDLIENDIDILFGNHGELTALYETEDLDAAIAEVEKRVDIAAITCGPKGSIVVGHGERHEIPAWTVEGRVLDTTGAGDLYASGFLHGITRGRDLATCARLGHLAAGEVISHLGPRPEVSLSELATQVLKLD
ncbi:MAG: adenosine kinase [Actinomycetota bacterium]|nr:adenosine kinase [Actinomycetota bacterium]